MPKELHDRLMRQFSAQGLKGDALQHAVYGTMTNIEKKVGTAVAKHHKKRKR